MQQKNNELPKSEIEALLQLLEDPDPYVHEKARECLLELGEKAIPVMDEYSCKVSSPALREQIRNIIRTLSFGTIDQEFAGVLERRVKTLEELEKGVFILSKLDHPTIRTEPCRQQLDAMARELSPQVAGKRTSDACKRLLTYLFEEQKFRGATEDYFNPVNSYIHKVLEYRRGIPIALSMVVLFVARRLDLPIEGVNMPMHFLLRYPADSAHIFIDPFNGGAEVRMEQCVQFLSKCGIRPGRAHFEAATPSEMLARTLRNLINCYEKRHACVQELRHLLDLVETTQLDL